MDGVDIMEVAVVLRLVNAMEPGMLSAMANVDKLEQKFQNLSKNANFHFSAVQKHAFNISKGAAVVGAGMTILGAGAVAAIKPMVEQAALMQKAMTNVQVATTGAIKSHKDFAAALAEVKRQSIGIGGATQFSAPEVAGFASKLATMGFHDPRMLTTGGVNKSLLMKVSQFAEAERQFRGVSPETSITSAGKIAGLLGMMNNPAQFKKALELVFQASMLTPASLPQIVTMMGQMGSVSSAMLKPNDRVMLTAFLGRISSGRQGNQLATMFARLIPNIFGTRSGSQMKAMEAAGLIDKKGHLEYFDKKGNFIGMMPFLDLMEKKLSKFSTMQRQALEQGMFQSTGLKVFEPLMQPKNLQALKDMLEQQKKMISLQDAQQKMWETFTGQVTNLKTNFNSLLMTLGDHLLGPLTAVLQKINDIVLAVLNWAQTHQKLTDALIKIAAVLAGIMIVVGPILMALGAMGMAVIGITGLVTAFGGLGLVAATILPPLAAVAGVIALIVLGWRMWSSSSPLGVVAGKHGTANPLKHLEEKGSAAVHIGAKSVKGLHAISRVLHGNAAASEIARLEQEVKVFEKLGFAPGEIPSEKKYMAHFFKGKLGNKWMKAMKEYKAGKPLDAALLHDFTPYHKFIEQDKTASDAVKRIDALKDTAAHAGKVRLPSRVAQAVLPFNLDALGEIAKTRSLASVAERFSSILAKMPELMHLFPLLRVGIAGMGAVLGTIFTPLDLIIFAVQGLAQAVIHHWAEIRATTSQTWKEVSRQIKVAFSVLNQYFGKGGSLVGLINGFFAIFQFITDEFERFFVGIWPGLATIFKGFWEILQGILTVGVKGLLDVFKTFDDLFHFRFNKLGDDLSAIWTDAWTGLVLVATGLIDAFIKGPIEMLAGGIANVLDGVFDGFKAKIHGIASLAAQIGGPQQGFFKSLANDTAGPAKAAVKPPHTSAAAWAAAQAQMGWAAAGTQGGTPLNLKNLPAPSKAALSYLHAALGSNRFIGQGDPLTQSGSYNFPFGAGGYFQHKRAMYDTDFSVPYGTHIAAPVDLKFMGRTRDNVAGLYDQFQVADGINKGAMMMALHMSKYAAFKPGQFVPAGSYIGDSGAPPGGIPHLCWVTDKAGHEELMLISGHPKMFVGTGGGGTGTGTGVSKDEMPAFAQQGGVHVHMAAGAVVLNGHPAPGHIVSAAEAALKKAAEVSFAHGPHSGATIHHPRPGGGM